MREGGEKHKMIPMGARNESGKTWLFNYSFDYDSRRNERWLMEIIDTIMKNQQLIWKKVIFSSGIIFQILFMLLYSAVAISRFLVAPLAANCQFDTDNQPNISFDLRC
mgnify:CR=1 FL=1